MNTKRKNTTAMRINQSVLDTKVQRIRFTMYRNDKKIITVYCSPNKIEETSLNLTQMVFQDKDKFYIKMKTAFSIMLTEGMFDNNISFTRHITHTDGKSELVVEVSFVSHSEADNAKKEVAHA